MEQMYKSAAYVFTFICCLSCGLVSGCGESEPAQNEKAQIEKEESAQDGTGQVAESARLDTSIMRLKGTWELVEKRIPEPIEMQGTFYIFQSNGMVRISVPGEAELPDKTTSFTYTEDTLSLLNTNYYIQYLDKDSMVWKGETIGIEELTVLVKVKN